MKNFKYYFIPSAVSIILFVIIIKPGFLILFRTLYIKALDYKILLVNKSLYIYLIS